MFKTFRKRYGLSQADMAKLCGVPRTTYQYWEKNPTSEENQEKIKKAMKKVEDYARAVKAYRQNQITAPKQEIKKTSYTTLLVIIATLLLLLIGSMF
jgi:DNA-binding XRE family transcriptional regulator